MIRLQALLTCLLLAACSPATEPAATAQETTGTPERSWAHGAMVSGANPDAVAAAIAILERGGHAVDAAIAAHAVLGLVEPESSGLGGSAGDVTWQFASADNMALFKQDPEAYAPQFGGYCSFAVSKGFTADISPDAWHIDDGKLYVFADKNVRDDWVAGIGDGTLQASAANWEKR